MRSARRIGRRVRVSVGLAAAGLLGAAPAGADAPWSPPQTVGGNCCSEQQLVGVDGGVVLAGDTGLSFGAPQSPGGPPTFTAPIGFTGLISPAGVLGPLAPIGGGHTVVAMVPTGGIEIRTFGTIGTGETLTAASGIPGRALHASKTLALPQTFVVATTFNALLVRRCTVACMGSGDLAVVRLDNGRWSAPRAITRPSSGYVGGALTVLPGGTIAIAYERDQAIFVRRLASNGRLSPAQRVGTGIQSDVSIVSAGPQRLDVGWSSQAIDEGDAISPFKAQVACSSAIGHFTGRSNTLASIPVTGDGNYVALPGLAMKQDAVGRITIAWTGFVGGRFVVQTGGLGATCATRAQTIALPGADAVLGGLAVSPSGRATLAITAGVYGADPPAQAISESAHGILAAQRSTSILPYKTNRGTL